MIHKNENATLALLLVIKNNPNATAILTPIQLSMCAERSLYFSSAITRQLLRYFTELIGALCPPHPSLGKRARRALSPQGQFISWATHMDRAKKCEFIEIFPMSSGSQPMTALPSKRGEASTLVPTHTSYHPYRVSSIKVLPRVSVPHGFEFGIFLRGPRLVDFCHDFLPIILRKNKNKSRLDLA